MCCLRPPSPPYFSSSEPAEVEQNIASHGVVSTHSVIEVYARSWPVECYVAIENGVERLRLKEKTVLFCEYTQLMTEVCDNTGASGLIATACIEPHARHRTAISETPLNTL
jgi:hypothetical protein